MALQELHYTSVKSGPGGASGFQFVKLTGDVDPALCRQVEPLLAYEPPRSAPARPTGEDIAGFPVALSYSLLPQGGALLCNTTYLGTDYSGRYGNFYAHALYLPAGQADLGSVLPIEMWRSRSWCTRPGEAAGTAAARKPEPGPITRAALCDLAQQQGNRVEAFLTDVLGTLRDARNRILLVEGSTDAIALWITLACRSLPVSLAGQLTFTTYTQRPYLSAHQVTGMPADADFAFSEAEIASQYRVHADAAELCSPPAEPLAWAAAAVALWQAGKPELFAEAYGGVPVSAAGLDAAQLESLTSQLAAAAMAHDVTIPDAVFSAAVNWAEAHPSHGTAEFWQNLAAAVAKGRGELPAASLGRLCRAISLRWPPSVTAPLLSAYLTALPAALLQDPSADTGTARWALGRLAEDPGAAGTSAAATRTVLPQAFEHEISLGRGLVLLELAAALAVEDVPPRAASMMLAPALMAGGDSAADAARFLAATPYAALRERVLDCLHDEAASGSSTAPELASAVAGWTSLADLAGFPLLHAAADLEQARRDGQVKDNAAAFCRVAHLLRDAGLDDLSLHALRIALAGQSLAAGEACAMLACTQRAAAHGTQLDMACLSLVRNVTQIGPDVCRLVGLLRERAGEWMDNHDAALLDLMAAAGRLAPPGSQPGSTAAGENPAAVLRLYGSSSPVPAPVRQAVATAILPVLLSPERLEAGGPGPDGDFRELVACGDGDLIAAYARWARDRLADRLTQSASLHACCYTLWRQERDLSAGTTAWLAARDMLIHGLLATAASKMTDAVRDQTVTQLDSRQDGLGSEWLRLPRPQSKARPGMLSRARLTLRRTR